MERIDKMVEAISGALKSKKKDLGDFLRQMRHDAVPGEALEKMEDPLGNPSRHLMAHEVHKIGQAAKPRD